MHSVPARVDKAYWKEAVARSIASANCWATVLATSFRTKPPATMPRIPPLAFCNAVNRHIRMASSTTLGTEALANNCAMWWEQI